MKILQKFIFTSIYIKLVIAFLLVITPLYSLSLLMNVWGERIIREDISESMSSKVNFYLRSLDDEFNRIIRLQQSFITDRDLTELSLISEHMSDIEKTEAITSVYKKMQLIKHSSNYIESANVSIFAIDKTISSNKITSTINQEKLDTLKDQNFLPLSVYNSRLNISVLNPSILSINNGKEPFFMLDIDISKPAIEHVLSQFETQKYGNAMFYHNDGEYFIYKTKENQKLNTSIEKILQTKLNKGINKELDTIILDGKKYILSFEKSSLVNYTLLMYVPEEQIFQKVNEFNRWFWIISVISLVIVSLFSFWIYRLIHQPLKKLIEAFRLVETGNLTVSVNSKRKDEFNYLYEQFNSMIAKLKNLITEVYEQKYRAQNAELKHLQSQVNPHFLYNSFFILNRMVKKQDYENLLPFSKNLAEYFRFINRDGRDDVPIELEVNYAKSYVNIQSFRFSNRITVHFGELPNQCKSLIVPRLILQPVIENAFEHGLKNKASDGIINISFVQVGHCLIITVEDNGEGLNDSELVQLQNLLEEREEALESTGIINIHHRLRLKFGTSSKLTVQRNPNGGLLVQLLIPIKGEWEDESNVDY